MKKIYRTFIFLSSLAVTTASAQTLRSSYFLEGMPLRHQLNPALMSDRSYVSIPVLGNLFIGSQGNVGISTFLYPTADNGLTTFMNKSVSADEFLNKLKGMNNLDVAVDVPIFSMGLYKWGGFNTFGITTRVNTGLYMPKELFAFMKKGQDAPEGSRYQIENFSEKTNAYVEVAFGHARDITDKLTAGAKVKFLLGGANVNARIDRMNVTMSEDQWVIDSHGYLEGSAAGLDFETDAEKNNEITGVKYNNPGMAGFGLGFDLGATYKVLDDLTVSMALTDIGFISWNKNLRGVTANEPFIFDGFKNIETDDNSNNGNSFDDQLDNLTSDLEELIKFYPANAPKRRATSLRTTLNIGAEYDILDRKISFGLLSSTRFGQPKTWTELMASANFRPTNWFNAALTGSVSNVGTGWGFVLNFCPKGFNFFIGTDHMITRVTPQWIPVGKPTLNVNIGFNITFGENMLSRRN